MGAALSSPIDEEKMKGIVEGTLTTFGEKYAKSYPAAILSKIADDARKEDGGSDYKLLSRPEAEASKEPIKTGWATKEGAVVKSWKKRFFVVRWDYKIEYYDKEETFKANGAPKGTINPSGYKVTEDPVGELTKRLEELSVKLKMDLGALGKPKTLPPNTVGLLRDRRRDWYIQFDSPAQVAEWVPVLKLAASKAKGLNNPDPVAQNAFNSAFDATRIARGYKSTKFTGSEEQNLSDLIVKQLESQVLPEVFDKIEADVPAGKMRTMAHEKMSSTIDSLVATAVSTSWNVASRAAETTRSTVEGTLTPQAKAIVEAQNKIREKIRSSVSPAVDRVVARIGGPVADVVLPVVMGPVKQAHDFLIKVFQKHLAETEKGITEGKDATALFKALSQVPPLPATFGELDQVFKIYHTLLDKAEQLGGAAKLEIDDVNDMITKSFTQLKTLLDNAFYTLQFQFQKDVKEGKDKATAIKEASTDVSEKLASDVGVSTVELGRDLLGTLVMPKVKEEVSEPAKAELEPIQSEVPEFLQTLVNLEDDLDATIEDIVNDALATLVRSKP